MFLGTTAKGQPVIYAVPTRMGPSGTLSMVTPIGERLKLKVPRAPARRNL
jgi:hypothetical protein